MKTQFAIAAVMSGSGKTTFTMGILRALRRRGMRVQPFKCGPDYIDTQFHTVASGYSSVNLDTWMATPNHVRNLYCHYSTGADACVTEGVMGLFDGYDRMKGSCAEISKLLGLPVVLVINAKSSAYTMAAVLHGLKTFDPDVRIAGVVFNMVASESHYSFLKDACADSGVECLGYIPKTAGIEVPSRHLGLSLDVKNKISSLADRIADLVEAHVNVERLIEICCPANGQAVNAVLNEACPVRNETQNIRTAVAHDAAFCFTYCENIDRLAKAGKIEFFSPLAGESFPAHTDLIYFPGGYPELFAAELSQNRKLASDLKNYVENGGKVLAECGGFMYLTRAITNSDGIRHEMAGVLPFESTMNGARLHLGYRCTQYNGLQLKGHEFHYSKIDESTMENMPSVAQQYGTKGQMVPTGLYRYNNVIAGYTHWYWGETNIFDLWR